MHVYLNELGFFLQKQYFKTFGGGLSIFFGGFKFSSTN
jgi:hypothetical protein